MKSHDCLKCKTVYCSYRNVYLKFATLTMNPNFVDFRYLYILPLIEISMTFLGVSCIFSVRHFFNDHYHIYVFNKFHCCSLFLKAEN